jgi:hypothetical protein
MKLFDILNKVQLNETLKTIARFEATEAGVDQEVSSYLVRHQHVCWGSCEYNAERKWLFLSWAGESNIGNQASPVRARHGCTLRDMPRQVASPRRRIYIVRW